MWQCRCTNPSLLTGGLGLRALHGIMPPRHDGSSSVRAISLHRGPVRHRVAARPGSARLLGNPSASSHQMRTTAHSAGRTPATLRTASRITSKGVLEVGGVRRHGTRPTRRTSGARRRAGRHAATAAASPTPGGEHRVGAVGQVADTGMVQGAQVHADLVGAPGLELDLEQRGEPVRLQRVVVGDAVPAAFAHGELVVVLGVPEDRRVDGAGERVRMALDQGVVGLVDRRWRGRRSSAGCRRPRTSPPPSARWCRRRAAARCPAARAPRLSTAGSPRRPGGRAPSGRSIPRWDARRRRPACRRPRCPGRRTRSAGRRATLGDDLERLGRTPAG